MIGLYVYPHSCLNIFKVFINIYVYAYYNLASNLYMMQRDKRPISNLKTGTKLVV